ncbi:transposase [Streptomyces sp. WI04-05B]|uniref:transposase n=1 Tax=Streptomyces TaxID=1883 RepID=UPI0039F4D472
MAPAALSLVTVLQFAENLTDRQTAATAVRAIDGKYAIGAELTDTAFGPSVPARFRARSAGHGLERLVFDRLVDHCRDAGLVGRRRQTAHRDHPRHLRGTGPEPSGAGWRERAGGAGGPRGGRPRLAGRPDRCRRVRSPPRTEGQRLDHAVVQDQEGPAGAGVRAGRLCDRAGRLRCERPAPRETRGQGARSRQVKNRRVGAARSA